MILRKAKYHGKRQFAILLDPAEKEDSYVRQVALINLLKYVTYDDTFAYV